VTPESQENRIPDCWIEVLKLEHGYQVKLQTSTGLRTAHSVQWSAFDVDLKFTRKSARVGGRHLGLQNPEQQDAQKQGAIDGESRLKTLGASLFDFLFQTGSTLEALQTFQDTPSESTKRLRLAFAQAPELASLPWEYLFNPNRNRFLAHEMRLIRDLPGGALADSDTAMQTEAPLRILVMISNADGSLNDANERQNLRDAFEDQLTEGSVHLEFVAPTYDALSKALRDAEYHVFHFIGHGSFDAKNNQGCLYFANKEPVDGVRLGALLHPQDGHSVRLAVLNACEGALSADQGLFTGVAGHLLAQGVPAVIAMQSEISDTVAIKFTDVFYEELAHGASIGRSIYEVRNSLQDLGSLEWGLPVLLMRGEGQLLARRSRPNPSSRTPPNPSKWLMIGQSDRLKSIAQMLIQSLNGEPRTVVISGAPGSGKTRMTDELVPLVNPSEQDFTVIRPQVDTVTDQPLGWIIAAIRTLYPGSNLETTIKLPDQTLRSVLRRVFFPNMTDAKEAFEPKEEHANRNRGLKWLIGGSRKPVLLVLEHLERIDLESLEVLHSLWNERRRRGLAMIVTAHADIELDASRMTFIQRWVQDQYGEQVRLQPLAESEITQLAQDINPHWQETWSSAQLHELSGGNPRALIECLTGSSSNDLENWYATRIKYITDVNACKILEITAVLGHVDTSTLLEHFMEANDVDQARQILERNGFIVTNPAESTIRFQSPHMAQAVLKRMDAKRIAILKRQIAVAMITNTDADPTRIASLFQDSRLNKRQFPPEESSIERQAYLHCATACDLRGESFENSISWITLALDLPGPTSDTQKIQLLCEQARILERHGKYRDALDALNQTDVMLKSCADPLIRNQARITKATILALKKPDQLPLAKSLAKKVLADLGRDTSLEARELLGAAHNVLGNVAMSNEAYKIAQKHFDESFALRNLTGSRFVTASLNNLGRVHRKLGDHAEAEMRLKQSLENRIRTGDKVGQARAQMNLGLLYQDAGQFSKADEVFADSNQVIQLVKDPWVQATFALNFGVQLFKTNRFERAVEQYERTLSLANDPNNQFKDLADDARYNLAETQFVTGQLTAAYEHLRQLEATTAPKTQIGTNRKADYFLLAAEILLAQQQVQGEQIAQAIVEQTNGNTLKSCLRALALLAGYNKDQTALESMQSQQGDLSEIIFDWAIAVMRTDLNSLQALLTRSDEPLDRYRILTSLHAFDRNNSAWQNKLEEFQHQHNAPTSAIEQPSRMVNTVSS
jgi:tetratricopeptide (TPR) repeat protein